MKIKELRLAIKKNQTEIAKALNITQEKYSRLENNITEPDIQTLIKLADYFHTTVDNLLEHNVPYLLDKSSLSEEQANLIDQIKLLNREQCLLTQAYIEGLKVGQRKQEELIKKLKGE